MNLGVEPGLIPAGVPWTQGMDRQMACAVSGGVAGMGSFMLDSVHQDERLDIDHEGTETFGCGNKKNSYLLNENALSMGRWDISSIVGVNKGSRETPGKCERAQWLQLCCRWRDRVKFSDQSRTGRRQEKNGSRSRCSQRQQWTRRTAEPSSYLIWAPLKRSSLLKGDGMDKDALKDEYRLRNVHKDTYARQN